MKFIFQLLAIIAAVLASHYLPAPDPEAFAAAPSAPWYVWLILAWIGVQSWPTIRARGQDAWGWVRSRASVPDQHTALMAVLTGIAAFGLGAGFGVNWERTHRPSPPTPVVVPVVDPVKVSDLRVLITFDAATKGQLPREQLAILSSSSLRTYLDAHCIKDATGRAEWRIIPSVTTFEADQPVWQKAMSLPRAAPNWLTVLGADKVLHSAPLPKDEAETMAIIEKWGGK